MGNTQGTEGRRALLSQFTDWVASGGEKARKKKDTPGLKKIGAKALRMRATPDGPHAQKDKRGREDT